MQKRAIIHIGFDKTGTSALQKYLAQHSAGILKRTGYAYPKIGRKGHDHLGVAHCCGFGFPDNAEPGRKNGEHARIARFFARANMRDVVISSEHFCYGADPNRFAKLRALFGGYDVIIVVYVRSLPAWLRSLYGEMVKWGFPGNFETFLEVVRDRMDYAAFLDHWSGVFGRANVVVLHYEKERGHLIQSFLRQFDSELAVAGDDGGLINPSIPPFESEVIRTANARLDHRNAHEAYDLYKFYAKLKRADPGRWQADARQHGRHGFAPVVANDIVRLTEKFASAYLKAPADRSLLIAQTLEDLALPAHTAFDAADIAARAGRLVDAYRGRTAPGWLDRALASMGRPRPQAAARS